jgi:tetratricopeptide (TPR) repeat protein
MFDIRRLFAAPRAGRKGPQGLADGLTALARHQYGAALGHFERALAGDLPSDERALVLNKRGVALVGLGDLEGARAAFQSALETVDAYAPALVNIGNLLLDAGAADEAIAYYRAALRSDEEYPAAHFNLGVALKRAGRTSEGVHHLRRAQRLAARRRS